MFYDDIKYSAETVLGRVKTRPVLGIILGSGLGSVVDAMEDKEIVPYEEIPGFPHSDLKGHEDRMVFGRIGGTPLVALQGRFHFYEGFEMKQVAYPVYVLSMLGVKDLIVTNACGAINESFTPGDLMMISDHINISGRNSLIGPNDDRLGPRFPDMTEAYNKELAEHAMKTAEQLGLEPKKGVYALFPGPCYETAAEIRAFKALGADAIGMSTVPEVIAANYLGMRVLGIACITNMATGIAKVKHSHEEVLRVAGESSKKLAGWITEMAGRWPVKDREE